MFSKIEEELKLLKFLEKENVFSASSKKELLDNFNSQNISPVDLLVKKNIITEEKIVDILSSNLGFTKIDLNNIVINNDILKLIPVNFSKKHLFLPIRLENKVLIVAMFNPFQLDAIMELESKTGYPVRSELATKTDIINSINKFHQNPNTNFKEEIIANDYISTNIFNDEIKLLKFLENAKIISSEVFKEINHIAEFERSSPISIAIENNYIQEQPVIDILSKCLNISKEQIPLPEIRQNIINLFPPDFAIENICIPLDVKGNRIEVGIFNPFQTVTIEEIGKMTNLLVTLKLVPRSILIDYIKKNYFNQLTKVNNHGKSLAETGLEDESFDINFITEELDANVDLSKFESRYNLLDFSSKDAPVVKLVNIIIYNAIKTKASDIHIEHFPEFIIIRYRIDGILHEIQRFPKWLQNGIVSRIKILSKMDIAEKRIPQDGNIKLRTGDRDIDLRVSTIPTHYGEKIVLRILQATNIIYIDSLEVPEKNLEILKKNIKKPQGIILVTGPTGSGKTSTLYACINEINVPEKNILTIEDPIEFDIAGVNQVQINPKAGMNFANTMRSFLRQDPNVIMVGEIRDKETAEIAFNAAMTGHLVFSTLHTNGSVSAITRLIDLEIPPFLIASSLLIVIAQRLLRKNCTKCLTDYEPDKDLIYRLGLSDSKITYKKGKGCQSCNGSGYKGRIGVFEVLNINENLRSMIHSKATESDILKFVSSQGMTFLLDDAIDKLKEGLTSLEEINRVIPFSEEDIALCPHCKHPVKEDFSICPYCYNEIHKQCPICNKLIDKDWLICPYCHFDLNK